MPATFRPPPQPSRDPWNVFSTDPDRSPGPDPAEQRALTRGEGWYFPGEPRQDPPNPALPKMWRWQALSPGTVGRIGEVLVRAGALTERERDQALSYQQREHVSFGVAVLEMGLISEELLLRALFLQHSAHPALAPDFARVSEEAISLVPRRLIPKYTVFPLHRTGRSLHVALAQPAGNPGIERLATLTGLLIVPRVAIAARIIVAAEKHYGYEAPERLRALVVALDRAAALAQASSRTRQDPALRPDMASHPASSPRAGDQPAREPLPAAPQAPASRTSRSGWEELPDPWGYRSGIALRRDAGNSVKRSRNSPPGFPSRPESHVTVPAGSERDETTPAPQAPRADAPITGPLAAAADLDLSLIQARTPFRVARLILGAIEPEAPAAAIIVVSEDAIHGWRSAGSPCQPFELHGPASPPMLDMFEHARGPFTGPFTEEQNRLLFWRMGFECPARVAAAPVSLPGGRVLVLLAQVTGEVPSLLVPVLARLARKAAFAFQILSLKRRLRQLATRVPDE